MANSVILFSSDSTNLDSPTFELQGQRTVVAVGMMPGDFITFEIVRVIAGARSTVCGCRINEAEQAMIEGTEPLICPNTCPGDEDPQLVTLTAENPIVILDRPQNTLLRAIYNGTGVDNQTVTAWAVESNTPNLTDAMRGCPCCEEDWEATGETRCTDTDVLEQQINSCGLIRWVSIGEPVWVDTPNTRCASGNYEQEQISSCGNTRWIVIGPVEWTDTPNNRCQGDDYEQEQVNQCGDTRWVIIGPVEWTETGQFRCQGNDVEQQEINQCGDTRWVATGTVEWEQTGEFRCRGLNIEEKEINQCGGIRWVPVGDVEWVATGQIRCTSTTVEAQEVNQCGNFRWVDLGDVDWQYSGRELCIECVIHRQQVTQCGAIRWINTGESCAAPCECGPPPEDTYNVIVVCDPGPVEAGEQCWTITVDRPVEEPGGLTIPLNMVIDGEPLGIDFEVHLDQTDTQGQFCINVTPNQGESVEVCVAADTDDPLINSSNTCCTIVEAPPPEYDVNITCQATESTDTNGDAQICFDVGISPAAEGNINIPLILRRNGFIFDAFVTQIGSGQSTVQVCRNVNVPREDTHTYCLEADDSDPIVASSNQCCTDVDNPNLIPPCMNPIIETDPPGGCCGSTTCQVEFTGLIGGGAPENMTVYARLEGTYPGLENEPLQEFNFTTGVAQASFSYLMTNVPQASVCIAARVYPEDNRHLWPEGTCETQNVQSSSVCATSLPCTDPPDPDCYVVSVACPEIIPEHDGDLCIDVSLDRAAVGTVNVTIEVFVNESSNLVQVDSIPVTFTNGQVTQQVCWDWTQANPPHPTNPQDVHCDYFVPVIDSVVCGRQICTTCIACEDDPYELSIDCPQQPLQNGDTACWNLTLDRPVECDNLVLTHTWSGTNQDANSYPLQNPIIIPVGQTGAVVCQEITATGASSDLTLGIDPNPRLTGTSDTDCTVTVDPLDEIGSMPVGFGCCATEEGSVQAALTFRPDRTASAVHTCQAGSSTHWLNDEFDPADYELNVTVVNSVGTQSGSITPGVWQNMGSLLNLVYTVSSSSPANGIVNLEVSIRRASDQTMLVTDQQVMDIELAAGPGAACV